MIFDRSKFADIIIFDENTLQDVVITEKNIITEGDMITTPISLVESMVLQPPTTGKWAEYITKWQAEGRI